MKNEVLSWIDQYSGPLEKAVYHFRIKKMHRILFRKFFWLPIRHMILLKKKQAFNLADGYSEQESCRFYRKKYKSEPNVRLDHFFDETGSWKSNDVLKDWDVSATGMNF
jgi:RNA polymerase sigma-70 factor (ECF subfamily)